MFDNNKRTRDESESLALVFWGGWGHDDVAAGNELKRGILPKERRAVGNGTDVFHKNLLGRLEYMNNG